MILDRLTVNNFRVFQGEHTLDLAPRTKYRRKRPIILFGGLNGSGKTTLLTSVRLVLYGKQSLGPSVSSKDYQEYLLKAIHRPKESLVEQPNSASIQLSFSYAQMGILKHYLVTRSWKKAGRGAKEELTITEDGKLLTDLNAEQCQGFLNELIPIGVSDLFFFDGEKISELAEDATGDALGDSIKKLLGLDLLDTLDADLGIFIRTEAKKNRDEGGQKRIASLENELTELKKKAANELAEYEQLKPYQLEVEKKISRLEADLSSRGGAWAATREQAIREQSALAEERNQVENRLREVMADSYPFVMAKEFVTATFNKLKDEAQVKKSKQVADVISERVQVLRGKFYSILDSSVADRVMEIMTNELSTITEIKDGVEIVHDVSERVLNKMESVIINAFEQTEPLINRLSKRLDEIYIDLDNAGNKIARSPEQDQIEPLLAKIRVENEKRTICRAKQRAYLENHKRYLREAIAVARQLEKFTDQVATDESVTRTLRYASNAKAFVRNFATEIAKRKIRDIEVEFVESFYRLARKGDTSLYSSINPATFAVTLHRPDGTEIDKDELSAGEKQIYAISILEALARTSGRHLPIIIDTPLGRLDSIHRGKLINQYFPNASHQVVILSTDTEVDETFYRDLSPSVSHAFKLDYEGVNGSTTASEGYFWREPRATNKAN